MNATTNLSYNSSVGNLLVLNTLSANTLAANTLAANTLSANTLSANTLSANNINLVYQQNINLSDTSNSINISGIFNSTFSTYKVVLSNIVLTPGAGPYSMYSNIASIQLTVSASGTPVSNTSYRGSFTSIEPTLGPGPFYPNSQRIEQQGTEYPTIGEIYGTYFKGFTINGNPNPQFECKITNPYKPVVTQYDCANTFIGPSIETVSINTIILNNNLYDGIYIKIENDTYPTNIQSYSFTLQIYS
jgi:hypothetical protein